MAAERNASAEEVGAEDERAPEAPLDLTNKSVIKATLLLRELGRHKKGITVTQIAQAVGMTRPTAFRMLLTLEQTGFVDRTDNRYMLGWRMGVLGRLADPYPGAAARIQPILDEYALQFNETVTFAMRRDGEGMDYDIIAEASGSHYLSVTVGSQYPLHASVTGKILLAELSDEKINGSLPQKLERYTPWTITRRDVLIEEVHRVREQGYAILDNELEHGLFAIGCAVRDVNGSLIGVLNVSGPTERLKSDRLPESIELLRAAADEVSIALS